MSDHPEDELLRLAADLAEGRRVDWTKTHSEDPEIGARMEDLRAIEAMALALQREPEPVPVRWLEPGTVLGRFRIERKAESGGMGVVYLARDQILDRQVALKLLPPNVAHSPARLDRLSKEAKLLASLNHPNIATIHGLEGTGDELRYLVLEWLSGETLAARLARGPLSVRAALEVCAQIAHGMAAAHEAGIVHRDLKPQNVMFAPGGLVKVVDFGLARRNIPFEQLDQNASGPLIAGTWGYSSPECLLGEEDHRADLFAFGCVLFECLVGAPTFPGKTAEEIHYAVLHREPDFGDIPDHCPASIRRLVMACLEKDPKNRFGSMAEAVRIIEVALGRRAMELTDSRTNLPVPTTSFIGRNEELKRYAQLLHPGRLLSLTGPGGAGKTRLALALARTVESEYSDGAWFVDLAPVPERGRIVEALGAALGVQEDPGTPLLGRIITQLSSSQALIVLDNCEHVLDDCVTTARAVLESCPGVSLVTTSRIALKIAGEQVVPVEPLPVPKTQDLDDPDSLALCDSVRLFIERATHTNPAFPSDPATLRAVGETCRRIEGLPLAIELAASRVRVLGIQEIADRLDRQLQLLRDPTANMTSRHRALQATIAWSVDQLTAIESSFFRALAVFAGDWDIEAATFVCGASDEFETLDLISSLVEKSLATVTKGGTGASRYRFLEPVRQFASGELSALGEQDTLRRRHFEFFLQLAETAEPRLYGAEQGRWLDRLADEHSNMLAALDYCESDPDRTEEGLRLVGALGRYWHVRGHVELGTNWLTRMLQRDGAEQPTKPRAQALSMAGALAMWHGERAAARVYLDEALRISRSIGDRRGEGRALLALGGVAGNSGDVDRGQAFYAEGLEVFRELGDVRGVATVLVNMGVLAYATGDRPGAHRLLGEAIDLHRKTGDRVTLALALGNRSAISVQLGDHDAARTELTEALQLSLELDAVWGGTSAIATVGMLASARGDFAGAAWMLAAVSSCIEKAGLVLSGSQRHEMSQMIEHAKASLAPEEFERAWRSGLELSFPQAARNVLAWLDAASGIGG